MHHPFLIGERCYLRGLEEDDLSERYFQWLNDFDVTRYLESGRFPNSKAAQRNFFEHSQQGDKVIFAIVDKANDCHIGNIGLHDLTTVHRRASLGILIGDKAYWGKGFGTEATWLAVDYGFRRLNLHSIWLGVLTVNVGAIKAYEKVGFTIDGTNREAWWADGRYHDTHTMSILAHEHFARVQS